MANDLNKAMIIGRLGQDPDIRYMPNGDAVANMSIASGWSTKDKEGTEWHKVTAFGKLAEIIQQYCVKGKQVYIEGRLQTRKWQDKDGNDRYTTEIVASQMQLLGSKGDDKPDTKRRDPKQPEPQDDFDDDIPF